MGGVWVETVGVTGSKCRPAIVWISSSCRKNEEKR